jgi:signal transduction histidine kinase
LAGQSLHGVRVIFEGQAYGMLALALPKGTSAESVAASRAQLAWLAREVALSLCPDRRDREGPSWREEQKWLADRAGVADLIDVATHEFNNILNNILMHLAIVERSNIPAALRDQTVAIRQKGLRDVDLVRRLQKLSRGQQPQQQPIDLNQVVRDTAAALNGGGDLADPECVIYPFASAADGGRGVRLQVDLAGDLPPALGNYFDLKHLLKLLLVNAAAVMGSGPGSITVRTRRLDQAVQLCVEDPGPSLNPEELSKLFELFAVARPGDDGARLVICKAVARRLQATIRGENRPEGGMVFVVELRPADTPQDR